MYKYKYYKYKNKYLNLQNQHGGSISKYLNLQNQHGDSISKYLNLQNQHGGSISNLNITDSYNKKDRHYQVLTTHDTFRVPFYEVPFDNLKEDDITNNMRKPDSTKVLMIDSTFLFDIFTKKYCGITNKCIREDKSIFDQRPPSELKYFYVKWDQLAKDFKGFYLKENEDLKFDRCAHAYMAFKEKPDDFEFYNPCNPLRTDYIRYKSWWAQEYEGMYNVMMFDYI